MTTNFQFDLPRFGDEKSVRAWRDRITERLKFSVTGSVQTIDATGTTIIAMHLEPLTVYGVECWTTGLLQETTGAFAVGNAEMHVWVAGVKLNSAGSAAFIGSGAFHYSNLSTDDFYNSGTNSSDSGWVTVLTVSENKVVMNVQGASTDVVRWKSRMKFFQVGI